MCFVFIWKQTTTSAPIQQKLIGFYNPDEKCLQRGTDWVFKYSGLRCVFSGLILLCTVYEDLTWHLTENTVFHSEKPIIELCAVK